MDSNNFVIIDVEGQNYQKLDDKKDLDDKKVANKKESAKKVAAKKVVNKEIVASKKVNKRTNTDIPSYNMNRNDLVYLFIGTNIFSFGMGIFSYYLFE